MSKSRNEYSIDSDLIDRKGVRVALFFVIPAVIFILVCAAIRVSQYGIDHTIIVLGQKDLVSGRPGAVRITLISDGGNFFLPSKISSHLVRDSKKHLLFDGPCSGQGYSLARNFSLPQIETGPWKMVFDIEFDDKRRIVETDVVVVEKPSKEKLILPEDVADKPPPNPVLKDLSLVRVFTEDRGAPTGLASVIFLRSENEEGKPTPVSMEIETPNGSSENKKKQIETDVLGLYAMPIKPLELGWPIRVPGSKRIVEDGLVFANDKAEKTDDYLHPKVVYAGISGALHNPIISSGDRLRVNARQLSSTGPVYIDLFNDGQWVQAASGWFQNGTAEINITPVLTGIGRMQLTTSVIAPGKTVAVRHFYVLKDGEEPNDGLKAVLDHLKTSEVDGKWASNVLELPLERGAGFDRRLAAAFSLSRFYKGHREITKLINSRSVDDKELGAFKDRFQRWVMLAILLIGFGVATLIVMIALRSSRTQKRVTMMILAGDSEEDEDLTGSTEEEAKAAKRRAVIQGAVLFLIIMAAFISVAILVDTLTWQR